MTTITPISNQGNVNFRGIGQTENGIPYHKSNTGLITGSIIGGLGALSHLGDGFISDVAQKTTNSSGSVMQEELSKVLEKQKKNSTEYKTDHKGTINYYVDLFRDSDYLCSNEIDGKIFYEWMMDLRETTNYRNIHFNEPDQFDILEEYVIKIAKDKESIKDILDCFEADWDYFCFSEESAWIAGPYKKIKETAEKFQQKGNSLEDEQKDYITKLMDLLGLSNLKNTFVI